MRDSKKEQHWILRRLKLSKFAEHVYQWQQNLIVKFVEKPKELKTIYRFVHERYIDAGIIEPQPNGLWVTKYHLFPDTKVVAAYLKNDSNFEKPICTATIVFDKPKRGLPCDGIYQDILDELRAQGKKLVELCSLAALPNLQARNAYFILFKMLYKYIEQKRYTDIVVVIKPKHRSFYKKILRFRCFKERTYPRFRNVTALLAHLDLIHAEKEYKEIYSEFPKDYNLYLFFKRPLY
ncbi:N-acyl amino acid synthase FeeM domain-containing protein [Thermodesulfatator atlanticus]